MTATRTRKVTQRQAEKVLGYVAEWMGRKGLGTLSCSEGRPLTTRSGLAHDDGTYCDDLVVGPVPTGSDAAYRGMGPELLMGFTGLWYTTPPTPTVMLEGGPDEWAIACSYEIQRMIDAAGLPLYVEPACSFALSIYRTD